MGEKIASYFTISHQKNLETLRDSAPTIISWLDKKK